MKKQRLHNYRIQKKHWYGDPPRCHQCVHAELHKTEKRKWITCQFQNNQVVAWNGTCGKGERE